MKTQRVGTNILNTFASHIRIGLGITWLVALTGCVGVGGGYYGGDVVVAGPEVGFWGGGFERGHDVDRYSHRGAESRAVAHPGGGHEGRR